MSTEHSHSSSMTGEEFGGIPSASSSTSHSINVNPQSVQNSNFQSNCFFPVRDNESYQNTGMNLINQETNSSSRSYQAVVTCSSAVFSNTSVSLQRGHCLFSGISNYNNNNSNIATASSSCSAQKYSQPTNLSYPSSSLSGNAYSSPKNYSVNYVAPTNYQNDHYQLPCSTSALAISANSTPFMSTNSVNHVSDVNTNVPNISYRGVISDVSAASVPYTTSLSVRGSPSVSSQILDMVMLFPNTNSSHGHTNSTYSRNSSSSHNMTTTNVTPSAHSEDYRSATTCSAMSKSLPDSSQVSSTVVERASPYRESTNGHQNSRSYVLSEISTLMKSVQRLTKNWKLWMQTADITHQREENKNSDYLTDELNNFYVSCCNNVPLNELLPTARKLFIKTWLPTRVGDDSSKASQYESATSSTSLALQVTTEMDGSCTSREDTAESYREKLKNQEQHADWMKAQIHYLEEKLKEKNGIENKLLTTENELGAVKKKCEDLKEKLKKKAAVGCWRDENTNDYCCHLMSELKSNMLELLENEFKCCICDELLIEPGVTNCQHIFCTVCLNTWRSKKKECPICRSVITNVYKVNSIDEYITAVTSSISDKAYAERLQVIEDRKNANPPPTKKPNIMSDPSIPMVSATVRIPRLNPAHTFGPWPSTSQGPSTVTWQPPEVFAPRSIWTSPVPSGGMWDGPEVRPQGSSSIRRARLMMRNAIQVSSSPASNSTNVAPVARQTML